MAKKLQLIEELMNCSERVWKFKDSQGKEKLAYSAHREPFSQSIVFRTMRGNYLGESWGGSIALTGIPEKVTRTKFEAAKRRKGEGNT